MQAENRKHSAHSTIMIRYKLMKTSLTGDVYPIQVESLPFTSEDLKAKLSKHYGAVSSAVLDDALRIIGQALGEGRSVTLDGFGSFSLRLALGKDNVKDFDEVRTQDIRIKGIRFKAAKELRGELGDVEIRQVKGEKQRRSITTDDRWVSLYEYVHKQADANGVRPADVIVTVSAYKHLTGATDYCARKELALFEEEGKLRKVPATKSCLYTLSV